MSSSTSHTQPTPSDDDMLAAWQQLRRRDWPTLDEIKRSAALYQLVRGAALRKAQGLPPGRELAEVQTPAPARPASAHPAASPALRHPPLFDHKRAAAGERDDE